MKAIRNRIIKVEGNVIYFQFTAVAVERHVSCEETVLIQQEN